MKCKKRTFLLPLLVLLLIAALAVPAFAAQAPDEEETQAVEALSETGTKAFAAAVTIGIAAAVGAISMGFVTAKAIEGVARQPEAEGKIRTSMMLGLVFIETAIIYALLVVIMLIFVL